MAAEKATPHLLVIDDCTLTCRLLTALLTAEGYRVTTAHDGTSGLAAARHHSYDLAIVDLHLPDLSGIEVAGLLQPEVPFLALTIDRSPEAVQACIDKGALSYLVKPLDAESFLRQVRVALERGREQRNLRRALRDNHVVNKALGVFVDGLLPAFGRTGLSIPDGVCQHPQRTGVSRGRADSRGHRADGKQQNRHPPREWCGSPGARSGPGSAGLP